MPVMTLVSKDSHTDNNNNNYKTSIVPIIDLIIHVDKAKVVIGAWNCCIFLVEKQFQTNLFSVCYERCL